MPIAKSGDLPRYVIASIVFLRERSLSIELASYDARLTAAARGLGIPIAAI
jgi:hypothetical protein